MITEKGRKNGFHLDGNKIVQTKNLEKIFNEINHINILLKINNNEDQRNEIMYSKKDNIIESLFGKMKNNIKG